MIEFLTVEILQEHDACMAACEWFGNKYPEGASIDQIVKDGNVDSEWAWWYYNIISQDKRVYHLCGISDSHGVNKSNGINKSNGVNDSYGVNWSYGVNRSNGVNDSYGVNRSFGVYNSHGVDNALFLADKEQTYTIFGVLVLKDRYIDIRYKLFQKLGDWRPTFNNIKSLWLQNGSNWELTPVTSARELSTKEAWADMPQEAVDFVKSLPEFNQEMWNKITGGR